MRVAADPSIDGSIPANGRRIETTNGRHYREEISGELVG